MAPRGEPGPVLILADAGTTTYTIILPRSPSGPEQQAAEDLAEWPGEMTGATFPHGRHSRDGQQ